MDVALSVPAVLCGLSAALSGYFLLRVWPYRDRPGGTLFVVTIAAMALWAGTYGVALTVFDVGLRRLLELPLWIAVNGTGLAFFAFALAYTGRSHLLRSPVTYAVGAASVASLLVLATDPLHGIARAGYAIDPAFGAAAVTYERGLWFYATVSLDFLLVGVGVLLLADTVVSYGRDYRRQAIAIALSPIPILLATLPWLFRVGPGWQLNFTPLVFPVHLALDMYALFQANMFVLTPGVRRAGERAAIDDLGTAVVLVDDDDRVVTLNAEAERVFGVDVDDALARPLADLAGPDADLLAVDSVTLPTDGVDRRYAVTTSAFTDAGGAPVGTTVVLQDVTRDHRREQRLTVLNRVLRHNLRNDLTVVRGHAELLATALDDPELRGHAETVVDETDGLVSLGEKARTFEGLVGEERDHESVSLHTVLEDVVSEARRDHPDASITLDASADAVVETDPDLVRLAVAELVENAVLHGGETPRIEVSLSTAAADGSVVVTVADDGPGIPDHEVAALGATGETDLEHASGIGLWLVQWSTDALGGDVTFETGDETENGTAARVRLPDLSVGASSRSAE